MALATSWVRSGGIHGSALAPRRLSESLVAMERILFSCGGSNTKRTQSPPV